MYSSLVPYYRHTKYDYLKTILFMNFLVVSAGTIYYKKFLIVKNIENPYFFLLLAYMGMYLTNYRMLPLYLVDKNLYF